MIYGENVRILNFSQSADLITEWVIYKCAGLSYCFRNDHSELFELLSDAVHWEANQPVHLVCIVWNSHQVIKS